jgi:N-acetylglucosaminyldiphosphoundecaprenol N-acetyl-beta-D-mannosaminyltransferase
MDERSQRGERHGSSEPEQQPRAHGGPERERAPVPTLPRTREVLGVPLAVCDYERVLDWIDAAIAADARCWVTAAAVNLVMSARDDPTVKAAVAEATLAVPDGVPLVWALRTLGDRAATRVYGPDLMALQCARAAASQTPIYLYGGRDEPALELLREKLEQRFPGLRIVGGHSPPYRPLSERERASVVAEINDSGAQLVWVGIGQPKQELWMAQMRESLRAPVLVGVGAAFDFHAGLVAQAPPWMQRAGLEWLFRLSREPRRLWRRYATQNPRFLAEFARQLAARRRGSDAARR